MSTKSSKKSYEPGERRNHSTVRVGDSLYMWGGFRTDFPEVHNSNEKRMKSSVVEVYHLPTGMWEQKPTTGNPPLGIHGYASAAIGNEIFYFGGDCNHQGCYHNSLHSFNVKTFRWKELSPTTSHHGPMMKRDASMVAMRMYGEDYLVVIGGWGLSYNNTPKQPEAEYRGLDQVPDLHHCNEIHYYKLSSGEWMSPLVKGDRPPPISHFTLASLSTDSAILFGGLNVTEWSNRLYFIKFSKKSLDISEIIPKKPSQWPQKRYAHSGVLINTIDFPEHLALPKENYKSGSYLLVVGGMNSEDCWLLDISNGTAKRFFNLPGAVTDRFYHSLSVWELSPDTYQIIEFGGGGQSSNTAVSQLRRINHEWFFEANPMQPDLDLREKRKRKWSERQSEETSLHVKKQSLERELEEEIRRREQTTIRLRKDLQEREKQLRMTEESFQEALHLVKDEKESAQFEYLRPQLDLLDGDVVIAEKNLFLPLDETSSFRWKKYGFRFQCPQGAVSKGTKMAITALVGGNFILPKGTVLVSAVYAISVSKPLLKPLVIELQHCVDLRTNAQADCLKFVRAPLKSPYEFSPIDGGSFNVGRRYGSIKRDQFSLVAIVAEMSNEESASPSGNGESEENDDHGTSNQDFIEEMVTETASNEAMVGHAEAIAETRLIGDQPTSASQTESLVQIESNNYVNRSDIWYTGMMYHERRDTGYRWITMYTAVKDLDAVLQHIENEHSNAERDVVNTFKFNQGPNGIIKLTLGTLNEAGWSVQPHQEPMELHQSVMDNIQSSPMVSTLRLSVYAVPGVANMPLHCPIDLTGINPSTTIFINRLPSTRITISTGSSSINFDSVRSIPESRREKACEAITNSTGIIRDALDLGTLANKLLEKRIINEREQREVLDDRTGLTTDRRMDKLLSFVRTTIRLDSDGNTFLLFIQIITEEDTIRTDMIAKRLVEYYNNN
ncbi:PREDICTED: uncharacterized protein LOC109582741 [Amphimedon queenslandica]|uniref:ZU5 domain-containing protein n=1 Tax=Amphimedon queenslandica TaxID=400682 RepID=A0AAN0J866_AMPQE|nr:PREDICTED: uncharacterized protein LOC109582741 [Amphimedon queenslandica]|eukprot:XP_019853209.1 PREDICTED: uncharacterized protein LOC109582741 [Amphimedon queenslandica]